MVNRDAQDYQGNQQRRETEDAKFQVRYQRGGMNQTVDVKAELQKEFRKALTGIEAGTE